MAKILTISPELQKNIIKKIGDSFLILLAHSGDSGNFLKEPLHIPLYY